MLAHNHFLIVLTGLGCGNRLNPDAAIGNKKDDYLISRAWSKA